jgi:hypothetical protein
MKRENRKSKLENRNARKEGHGVPCPYDMMRTWGLHGRGDSLGGMALGARVEGGSKVRRVGKRGSSELVAEGGVVAVHGGDAAEEELTDVGDGHGVAAVDAFAGELADEVAEKHVDGVWC